MKSTFKIFALLFVILFSSCKKELQEKQNKIILLTKPSGWLTLKIEEKSTNGSWVDITRTINPINIDNLLIFDPWYVWAINEGALKLPGNPQVPFFGTWSFTDKETKIQFKEGDKLGNLVEVVELTETSLQTTFTSGVLTSRYTYKHP